MKVSKRTSDNSKRFFAILNHKIKLQIWVAERKFPRSENKLEVLKKKTDFAKEDCNFLGKAGGRWAVFLSSRRPILRGWLEGI